LPTGLTLGSILGLIGIARIVLWQRLGFYDYGEHWLLTAVTVAAALVGIVTFGSMAGSDATVRPYSPRIRSCQRIRSLR
jgi:magnesium transporter